MVYVCFVHTLVQSKTPVMMYSVTHVLHGFIVHALESVWTILIMVPLLHSFAT